ncbi:hypothetical protein QOZ80_7BG0613540 [Eleusine coracana subsp. coracana]|nr:hypothetical protein QOZ80_7BG0613540 [Eleusine coracana subsp. coracana]
MDAMSCFAPPAALLTSFADAALHFSMSSADSSASSSSDYSSHHQLLLQQQPTYPVTCSDSVLVAADYSPPPQAQAQGLRARRRQNQQLIGPVSRSGKRRSRASKRAPTTYISTDPSNFRIMVQHVTGVQQADSSSSLPGADPNPMLLLAADTTNNPGLLVMTAGDNHHHYQDQQQQQQQPCFPTLDSWNVTMYETSNDLL